MDTQLPREISFSETDRGQEYILPRRPLGGWRFIGLVPLLFGAFIASWPIIGVLVFLSGSRPQGAGLLFAILGPIVCFGPVCFPAGGFLLFVGLSVIAGHNEIRIQDGRLSALDRCGPLRWTRRRAVDQILSFRVESNVAAGADRTGATHGSSALNQICRLKADCANGKSITVCQSYPRSWLLPLAEELARRCLLAADGSGVTSGAPLPVAEESLDPTMIVDRPRQPTSSTAVLEQNGDDLTIAVPAAGLIRGNNKFFLFLCIFWNGFMLIFTPLFLPAAFAGEVKWEGTDNPVSPFLVTCFLTPFWLVGICFTLYLLYQGRRKAIIRVVAGEMTVEETGLFSTGAYRWRQADIASVAVTSKYRGDNEGGSWTTDLCIQPKSGAAVHIMSNRAKPELEWIATVLRWALQVPGAP